MPFDLEMVRSIDAPGCSCEGCRAGFRIPIDHPEYCTVISLALSGVIDPLNNTGLTHLMAWRNREGLIDTSFLLGVSSDAKFRVVDPVLPGVPIQGLARWDQQILELDEFAEFRLPQDEELRMQFAAMFNDDDVDEPSIRPVLRGIDAAVLFYSPRYDECGIHRVDAWLSKDVWIAKRSPDVADD